MLAVLFDEQRIRLFPQDVDCRFNDPSRRELTSRLNREDDQLLIFFDAQLPLEPTPTALASKLTEQLVRRQRTNMGTRRIKQVILTTGRTRFFFRTGSGKNGSIG